MLMNYVLPPKLEAEVYQALAAIPAVTVDSHVAAIDGRAGVAFVLPPTRQSEKKQSSSTRPTTASWPTPTGTRTGRCPSSRWCGW
jgi:hypothetical protein